jgi:DNA-directed RNA polymerase II subunit RPB1
MHSVRSFNSCTAKMVWTDGPYPHDMTRHLLISARPYLAFVLSCVCPVLVALEFVVCPVVILIQLLVALCVSFCCLSFIEKQKLDSAKMDNEKARSVYYIDLAHPDSLDSWMSHETKEALLRDREAHMKLAAEYAAIEEDRMMLRARVLKVGDDGVYLPVNMKRLIWNAQKRFRVEGASNLHFRSSVSPIFIIDELRKLCDRLVVIRGDDPLSIEAQHNATLLFKTMLRSTFAAKRVIKDYNLSKDAFSWLLGEVEARFNQALAHPGEMIGSIAAQSIGEPATQMTLNVSTMPHT